MCRYAIHLNSKLQAGNMNALTSLSRDVNVENIRQSGRFGYRSTEIKKCREEEEKHKRFILVRQKLVPISSPQETYGH